MPSLTPALASRAVPHTSKSRSTHMSTSPGCRTPIRVTSSQLTLPFSPANSHHSPNTNLLRNVTTLRHRSPLPRPPSQLRIDTAVRKTPQWISGTTRKVSHHQLRRTRSHDCRPQGDPLLRRRPRPGSRLDMQLTSEIRDNSKF